MTRRGRSSSNRVIDGMDCVTMRKTKAILAVVVAVAIGCGAPRFDATYRQESMEAMVTRGV